MPVTRCVCANVTFLELKRSGISTYEEMEDVYSVGVRCGGCIPYIRAMISTGTTEFEPFTDPMQSLLDSLPKGRLTAADETPNTE